MPFRESAQTANADSPGEREFEELTRITNELITTQRQLHKQSSELRRLNQEKNQAIGIVAHDLRNPLALIKMQAEVLLQELSGILSDEQCTLLQSITEQGTTMLTIVNDLLDVSAIEAGSFNIKLETVDVVGLIERFVQSQQLLSASKSIGIDFVKMPGTLFARVDPGKFLQVLGNLIGNAVKYSPPGSQVIVTLSRHPDTFEVRVQDFGPGIPADELESLFEPFKTASIVPSGDEKCTGLGLAIVRRIIEKHEGVFDVESQVDVGSVFSVRLPVGVSMQPNAAAVDCQSAAETLSAKSEDPKRLLRVLVVDDCKAAAKIMFRLIDRVCRS
ncbi:HAMP domain-containing sensor histidine kinase [Novipirellula rosea]|uniref:histidine kinase n=1 Tax=Novipirellula rosea TaxID=1031540 RepID=A0ABP8N2M3_9BACT